MTQCSESNNTMARMLGCLFSSPPSACRILISDISARVCSTLFFLLVVFTATGVVYKTKWGLNKNIKLKNCQI